MKHDPAATVAPQRQRVDKWLWNARFFKTRTLAARHCSAGRIRVNRGRVTKPSFTIRPGDILTFPQARAIRVVRVVAIAPRRGPATEARILYEDLSPEPAPRSAAVAPDAASHGQRERGAGRPTKADRRAIDALERVRS
ncbi:MAG: RNA-binding S4 domain-containing protein [Alphaproteobacteria bacterium]